ncbi:MAG: hypothetical protein WCR94_00095, partial [Bacteroides graminisolvens]
TVRNFFGGHHFKEGKSVGIHLESGPDGGLVMLDDTIVLDKALKILDELNISLRKDNFVEQSADI